LTCGSDRRKRSLQFVRHAVEQSFAETLRFLCQLNLGREMLACLQLRSQAADRDRDDEVSRKSQRIFELRDVQRKQWWDKQKIPGKRAECCNQQDGPTTQHRSEE